MRKVKHQQIYKYGTFGGFTNTTLCGRKAFSQWNKNDGVNVAIKREIVTCKLCLRLLNTPLGKKLLKISKEIQQKIKRGKL